MIPLPPADQYVQGIEKKLVDCGLKRRGISVEYVDDFQSYEIVIGLEASASKKQLMCIRNAATREIVTFTDPKMASAYRDFENELLKPQMLKNSTERAKALGLLKGFPRRRGFANLSAYARALEAHCGIKPGTALNVDGDGIRFQPSRDLSYQQFDAQYGKLLAAIMYASAMGDFEKFFFTGNEAVAAPDDHNP